MNKPSQDTLVSFSVVTAVRLDSVKLHCSVWEPPVTCAYYELKCSPREKYRLEFFFNYLFYFWPHWVFLSARGLSPGAASRASSLDSVRSLLLAVVSIVAQRGLWGACAH